MNEIIKNMKKSLEELSNNVPNFLKIKKIINPDTGKTLEYVDKKQCVIGLVLNHDATKALFVKQYRAGCASPIYECPAGVVDDGELAEDAMIRELREECGIKEQDVDSIKYLNSYYSSVGWTNEMASMFLITLRQDFIHAEQQLDEDESLTYTWFEFNKELPHELWKNTPAPIKSAFLVEMVLSRMELMKQTDKTDKPKICIFGGAFNPVTNLHMSMAERVIEEFNIEHFIFEPVNDNYNKAGLVDSEYRVRMLNDAVKFADNPHILVGDYEVSQLVQPTTCQTLDAYSKMYKNHDIYCVVGSDNLKKMSSWESGEDLLKKYHVVCIQREGDDNIYQDIIIQDELLSRYSNKIHVIYENTTNNISSTKVRALAKAGKSIKWLVPKPVAKYIKDYKIY